MYSSTSVSGAISPPNSSASVSLARAAAGAGGDGGGGVFDLAVVVFLVRVVVRAVVEVGFTVARDLVFRLARGARSSTGGSSCSSAGSSSGNSASASDSDVSTGSTTVFRVVARRLAVVELVVAAFGFNDAFPALVAREAGRLVPDAVVVTALVAAEVEAAAPFRDTSLAVKNGHVGRFLKCISQGSSVGSHPTVE